MLRFRGIRFYNRTVILTIIRCSNHERMDRNRSMHWSYRSCNCHSLRNYLTVKFFNIFGIFSKNAIFISKICLLSHHQYEKSSSGNEGVGVSSELFRNQHKIEFIIDVNNRKNDKNQCNDEHTQINR